MTLLLRILTLLLLVFNALGACYGGALFLLDPTGGRMGMTTAYLEHSPFTSYLIPGIILLAVNGFFNFYVALRVLRQRGKWPLLVLAAGLFLMGWIGIQVAMVREFNTLHATMGATGLLLGTLGAVQWWMR